MDSVRPTFAKRLKETLGLFDLSPEKYPFNDRRIKKIIERRKQLRGQLFFDYLLQQAGISKPAKLFPPPTPRHFEILIREILSSDWGITGETLHRVVARADSARNWRIVPRNQRV